jgi:hypothetical protein
MLRFPHSIGSRNDTTSRVALKYISMGLSHNEVILKLIDYNKQHNSPPLMPSEIFNIANHFFKSYKENHA